jgi:hypothetical protein
MAYSYARSVQLYARFDQPDIIVALTNRTPAAGP